MKKLVIATILAGAMGVASAADVTVRAGHNGATNQNSVGVAMGLVKSGPFGVEVGVDRSTSGADNLNRATLLATADVAKVWGTTVTAKFGGAYLDRSLGQSGVATLVGVGVSYPVTKTVSMVADYTYQYSETQVSDLNGGIASLGLRVSF